MTPQEIISHFKHLDPYSRAYLTVRALEIAGIKVDTNFNLAILSGKI